MGESQEGPREKGSSWYCRRYITILCTIIIITQIMVNCRSGSTVLTIAISIFVAAYRVLGRAFSLSLCCYYTL